MKKFNVTWVERFDITVEADSEKEAIEMALAEDPEVSRYETERLFAECIGGFCEDHARAYEGEECPACENEDALYDSHREKDIA